MAHNKRFGLVFEVGWFITLCRKIRVSQHDELQNQFLNVTQIAPDCGATLMPDSEAALPLDAIAEADSIFKEDTVVPRESAASGVSAVVAEEFEA
jgi:hypothetical protein